ncbi:MAG: glycoside hydrolase family 3 C-terminal domain-containing protein, partial [Lachnospiraceae bacterium]|nr:glycoside hydrolase family 3 C-terminal domain-containing protein [Lachnospiraceae bacterium]
MKGPKKAGFWRGMTNITASLLALSIGASAICSANASAINSVLGITNYKMESVGDSDVDGYYFDSEFTTLEELIAAQEEVAVQIAEEGCVLLKNENAALPIDKDEETVTLWGLNSTSPILGGYIGSAVTAVNDQYEYGIEEALKESGFSVNQEMIDFYDSADMDSYRLSSGHSLSAVFWGSYEETTTYNVGEAPASVYTEEVLASADGTTAIVVLSRDSSEAADYNLDMQSAVDSDNFSNNVLGLSDNERDMIELAKEHSSKVIVLINASNPMEIKELKDDPEIDSIMWVGMPGMYGFQGVAKVLCGEVSPSGHLSDTYVADAASSPSMVNWGLYVFTNSSVSEDADLTTDDKGDWYLVESEGIYSGYKYYETRYEDLVLGRSGANSTSGATTGTAWSYSDEVVYPFGYGLSYTTFEQTLESVEVTIGGTGVATVTVTNTGEVAGKSVVQLYVQTPYTVGGLEKASIQLLDFGKTDVLEPGESTTLTIEFDPQYMASY